MHLLRIRAREPRTPNPPLFHATYLHLFSWCLAACDRVRSWSLCISITGLLDRTTGMKTTGGTRSRDVVEEMAHAMQLSSYWRGLRHSRLSESRTVSRGQRGGQIERILRTCVSMAVARSRTPRISTELQMETNSVEPTSKVRSKEM
jgi:hypothetical protein